MLQCHPEPVVVEWGSKSRSLLAIDSKPLEPLFGSFWVHDSTDDLDGRMLFFIHLSLFHYKRSAVVSTRLQSAVGMVNLSNVELG